LTNSVGLLSIEFQKRNTTTVGIIILMSILLHQSFVIFGLNVSLSDFFCVLVLFLFAIHDKLVFPVKYILFFLLLSVYLLVNTIFIVPATISYYPAADTIASNFVKLLIVFGYFVLGYCLAKQELFDYVIKWYSIFGLIIGCLGIIMTFLNIAILSDVFFYGGRFKGLMNDPNYYAILQVTALAIAIRKLTNKKYKPIVWIVVFLAVSISGSKTGMITFVAYLIIHYFEIIVRKKKKRIRDAILFCAAIAVLFLLMPYITSLINNTLEKIATVIPIFARIEVLFSDFITAISDKGSARDIAWNNAINLIALAPLLGIGIGTYSGLANMMFGSNIIAHNTYLQLAVEWGVPLTILFLSYVFYLLGRTFFSKYEEIPVNHLIIRDVIVVLLIASFAISLNNARMFWLFLGSFVFYTNRYIRKKKAN